MYRRSNNIPDGLDGAKLAELRERMKQAHARRIAIGLAAVATPTRGQAKAVACFDHAGRRMWTFSSVTEAARAVGTGKPDNICDAIRRGGKCAGLTWSYVTTIPRTCQNYATISDLATLAALVHLHRSNNEHP